MQLFLRQQLAGIPASLGPRLKTGSRANRRIGEN
jgi:hypothetical protein